MAIEMFQQFRNTHPASQVELGGTPWEYGSGGSGPRGLLLLGGGLSFGDTRQRRVTLFEGTRRVLSPSYPPARSLTRAQEHERKLEFFFRIEPRIQALPPPQVGSA